ncbi:MAG: T9SS type A sorting domain-containing protein [bacterium]|nr:T9SS type A sorting domain-containing protein [bacterium]
MYATSSWSFSYPVGIFRTNNGGVTWENLSEGFNGSVSVRDAALNFSEHDYTYIAANSSLDTSGVYVKIDDEPWMLIGLNDEYISSLIIKNNLLYVGTNNGIYVRELISNVESEINPIKNENFVLYQNYPNPFNPTTIIKFEISYLETTRRVVSTTLEVYDIVGNEVATLVNEEKQPGVYEVEFDGSQLSSGIYFYTLSAGNFTATKKLILIK